MVKTPWSALYALAASLLLVAIASAQSSPASVTVNGARPDATSYPPTPDASNIPVSDRDIYCPTALEPILPADYYACEARAASGRGNDRKMADMLKESAYWANKDAQYVLGLMYFNGDTPGIPQNRSLGLAWLALAAERKKPQYQIAYAVAHSKCTPEEIRQARVAYLKLRQKYADRIAAPRAIRHFNHAIEPIDDAARNGGIVYLNGFAPFPQSAFALANKLHDEADSDFSDVHGTVVVGKPEWVQAKPEARSPASDAK